MSTTTTPVATTTMTREQAEQVTADIRTAGKALVTSRTKFAAAVKRAKDGEAHVAMGLPSWTEYVATVFADMPGLGKADAEYLTAYMAGEGMSSRAVARVLGVSQSTAARMIKQAEQAGEVEADREVEGTDGKSRKASKSGKAGGTRKGKSEQPEAGTTTVKTAKTEELRVLALQILGELSDRWAEGDESAEAAVREIAENVVIAE